MTAAVQTAENAASGAPSIAASRGVYIARRLLWAVFVVWAATSIGFVLGFAVGDGATATLGAKASKVQLEAFRHRHGLDKPLIEQYIFRIRSLASPSLGTDLHDRTIASRISSRVPRTMLLMGLALLVELTIGLGLGIFAAAKRGTWSDTVAMGAAFVGVSAPTFLTGTVFLMWVAFKAQLFPVGGLGRGGFDTFWHAVLPAITLGLAGAATHARLIRSELTTVMHEDWTRTARAKGLSSIRTLFVHGVRNALVPTVTLIGTSLPALVGGAIITEYVYAWPGMGKLATESINTYDGPMILALIALAAIAVQAGNLAADLAVAYLDPRVRLEK